MEITHDLLAGTAKSWGLFYLIAFFACVVVYTFLPSNKKKFDSAEKEIFDKEDTPWR